MFKYCVVPALVLWFLLLAPAVQAYTGPATLSPSDPVAGDVIVVNIPYGGHCDAVFSDGDSKGFPQITIDGNFIRVVADSIHALDPDFCKFPEGVAFETIGPLPAGDYTVEVDRRYTYDIPPIVTETIGVLDLTVRGIPVLSPDSVPTLGLFSTILVIALLALLGGFVLSWHSRGFLSVALLTWALVGSHHAAAAPVPDAPPTIEVMLSTAPGA